MPVGARIDQLRVNPDAIAGTLNASFHHIRHSELLPNLAQIARDPAFVMHHRSAADYFQVRDSCEQQQCNCNCRPARARAMFLKDLELYWNSRISDLIVVKTNNPEPHTVL